MAVKGAFPLLNGDACITDKEYVSGGIVNAVFLSGEKTGRLAAPGHYFHHTVK
jgi:hypothetical protein